MFIISSVKASKPLTYTTKDRRLGEPVQGNFYEQELQLRVREIFRIERSEVFVKWKGYSDAFNSWVPLTDLEAWISVSSTERRPTENYRENNHLLPRNLRGLVIGKSGCGETIAIFNLLLQPGWLGKSLHQQEYKVLRKDLEFYQIILLIYIYIRGENNNISKTDSYDSWCGEAWSQIDHDSVVRGFKKLEITTALDGLEGHLVNIPKLPEYEMPTDYMQNEFTVVSEGESDTSLELSDSDTATNLVSTSFYT